jgi:hypothetical protein
MEKKDIVSVCAWCPDKKEKTQEALSQWKQVTHWICKACQEVQEKAFQILVSKR